MNNQATFNTIVTIAGMWLVFKQRSGELWFSFLVGVNTMLETYDGMQSVDAPCTGNLLCERIGKRHKSGCLGK